MLTQCSLQSFSLRLYLSRTLFWKEYDGSELVGIGFVNNPLTANRHYHYAMGPTISNMPDISWEYVKKEKSEDMIHVLQFPYNGEPPRVSEQVLHPCQS